MCGRGSERWSDGEGKDERVYEPAKADKLVEKEELNFEGFVAFIRGSGKVVRSFVRRLEFFSAARIFFDHAKILETKVWVVTIDFVQ
mgnify:CR=1 FL=1